LVGIKSKVIERAKANRVGVLILCKGFRAPRDGVCVLCHSPRCAAIAGIALGAIMCPARMLRRSVETDVRYVYPWSKRYSEGLDAAIKVLVIERILIVPHASRRVGHVVTHKPNAVITRIWFDLIYGRACPGFNGWLLTHGAAHGTETKRLVDSSYGVPLV